MKATRGLFGDQVTINLEAETDEEEALLTEVTGACGAVMRFEVCSLGTRGMRVVTSLHLVNAS